MNFMPINLANSNELLLERYKLPKFSEDLLLERYKLSKFSEEDIDNVNYPISMWEFEFVIKN